MGIRFDLLFMIPCLGFTALFAAWLVFAFTSGLRSRAGFGIIGSLIAALVLGVLWQADHLPWLWQAGGVKAIPMIWLGSAVLNGFAIASGRGRSRRVLATAISLGVAGFLLHALGGFAFLWGAAMSV
jgi:hypothetical protein